MYHEALFFLSALFFLLAGLLYDWGPPAWFSLFPYSAGLRFLLALEAYFLCCAVFFSFRLASFPVDKKRGFAKAFCVSFAAIPFFSLLVILNVPIQVLRAFSGCLDIAAWLSVMALSLRTSARERAALSALSLRTPARERAGLSALSLRTSARERANLSALFVLSGMLLLVPAIPSIAVIAARFLFLAIFSVRCFQSAQSRGAERSVQGPADFREVAERFALSPRETEVLALLAAGKTNGEIADALFISLSTVKTHIPSIFGKTGARNRLEVSARCKKT